LFASDFSEHSKKVYHHFLKQMGPNLEELILYHAISLPVAILSASAFSGVPATLTDNELEEQVNNAQSLCESWMNEARANHLKVRFHAKVDQAVESLGRAILDVAKSEQVGMVALASHAGPLQEMFLGSVTRDVFEVATYPVWVCGPRF
jgi:nucleotide-binding universal stress UspA family protein